MSIMMVGPPPNYSDITVCPRCGTRVALEDVQIRTFFKCPHCTRLIRVRPSYLVSQSLISQGIGFCISYMLGLRWLLLIVVGVGLGILIGALYTLLVKYFVPPRLEIHDSNDTKDTSITKLDLNHK
jgi:DNA-directed RNA polymerase subunit RPC12/RpoP